MPTEYIPSLATSMGVLAVLLAAAVAQSRVRAEREAISPISRMQSRGLSLGADEGNSGGALGFAPGRDRKGRGYAGCGEGGGPIRR